MDKNPDDNDSLSQRNGDRTSQKDEHRQVQSCTGDTPTQPLSVVYTSDDDSECWKDHLRTLLRNKATQPLGQMEKEANADASNENVSGRLLRIRRPTPVIPPVETVANRDRPTQAQSSQAGFIVTIDLSDDDSECGNNGAPPLCVPAPPPTRIKMEIDTVATSGNTSGTMLFMPAQPIIKGNDVMSSEVHAYFRPHKKGTTAAVTDTSGQNKNTFGDIRTESEAKRRKKEQEQVSPKKVIDDILWIDGDVPKDAAFSVKKQTNASTRPTIRSDESSAAPAADDNSGAIWRNNCVARADPTDSASTTAPCGKVHDDQSSIPIKKRPCTPTYSHSGASFADRKVSPEQDESDSDQIVYIRQTAATPAAGRKRNSNTSTPLFTPTPSKAHTSVPKVMKTDGNSSKCNGISTAAALKTSTDRVARHNDDNDDAVELIDDGDPIERMLFDVFHLPAFRPKQRAVVDLMVQGEDLLYIFPTGMGKSLCYQFAAYVRNDLTVVVSPLIALMGDQMRYLQSLPKFADFCACLNSSMPVREQNRIVAKLRTLKLLYVSPETLKKIIRKLPRVGFLVVDEAHCISEWGHDFRPTYSMIGELREQLGKPPCAACTATATTRVQEDIIESLHFASDVRKVQLPFDRPNLHYSVRCDHSGKLDEIVEECMEGCGILYCFRKADCEEWARTLQRYNIKAKAYHASLKPKEKAKVAAQWKDDQLDVVCCTIAFGMGVDKQNVRFVIHVDPPKSMENYAQETGRAGRDGLQAYCIMYYAPVGSMSRGPFANDERTGQKLQEVEEFAFSKECRRVQLLNFFGQKNTARNGECCDVCNGNRGHKKLSSPSKAKRVRKEREGIGQELGFRPATSFETILQRPDRGRPRKVLLPEPKQLCASSSFSPVKAKAGRLSGMGVPRKVLLSEPILVVDASSPISPVKTDGVRSPLGGKESVERRRSRRLLNLPPDVPNTTQKSSPHATKNVPTPSSASSSRIVASSIPLERRKTRSLLNLSLDTTQHSATSWLDKNCPPTPSSASSSHVVPAPILMERRKSRPLLNLPADTTQLHPVSTPATPAEKGARNTSSAPSTPLGVTAPLPLKRQKTRPLLNICPDTAKQQTASTDAAPAEKDPPSPSSVSSSPVVAAPERRKMRPLVNLSPDTAQQHPASARDAHGSSSTSSTPLLVDPERRKTTPLLNLSADTAQQQQSTATKNSHPTTAPSLASSESNKSSLPRDAKTQAFQSTASTSSFYGTPNETKKTRKSIGTISQVNNVRNPPPFNRGSSSSSLPGRLHPPVHGAAALRRPSLLPLASMKRYSSLNAHTVLPFQPVKRPCP